MAAPPASASRASSSPADLARADRDLAREHHRAGVEPGFHAHDADARPRVAGEDRARDRRCAAPARQQRSVDVEATEARHGEHLGRQQQAVGDDHHDVRREGGDRARGFSALQRRRLQHREPQRERALLHRARREMTPAPARAVGLRERGDDAMARRRNGVERRNGEIRGSGEGDRQAAVRRHGVRQIAGAREVSGARPSARSLRSFSSFLRTRWRFISER